MSETPEFEIHEEVIHTSRGKGTVVREVPGHPSVLMVKFAGRGPVACWKSDLSREEQ